MNPQDREIPAAPCWPLSLEAPIRAQPVVVDAAGRSRTLAGFQDDCRERAQAMRREAMLGLGVGFGWRMPRRPALAATWAKGNP